MNILIQTIKYDDANNVLQAVTLMVDGNAWTFYVDGSTQSFQDLWNWCIQCSVDFKANGYSSSAYTYQG